LRAFRSIALHIVRYLFKSGHDDTVKFWNNVFADRRQLGNPPIDFLPDERFIASLLAAGSKCGILRRDCVTTFFAMHNNWNSAEKCVYGGLLLQVHYRLYSSSSGILPLEISTKMVMSLTVRYIDSIRTPQHQLNESPLLKSGTRQNEGSRVNPQSRQYHYSALHAT
jgi:hypothetical protein